VLVSTKGCDRFPAAAPPNSAFTLRFDARHGCDVTTAVAEETAACTGLDMAASAGLDIASGAESATGALGVIDALGVADVEATDDNCDADEVSAFRVLHW